MTSPRSIREGSLVGFFGHIYEPDPDDGDQVRLQYQFEIIREMKGARYTVQLFSFLDGRPTELRVFDESVLLGPNVKLYATREIWLNEYEVNIEQEERDFRKKLRLIDNAGGDHR